VPTVSIVKFLLPTNEYNLKAGLIMLAFHTGLYREIIRNPVVKRNDSAEIPRSPVDDPCTSPKGKTTARKALTRVCGTRVHIL